MVNINSFVNCIDNTGVNVVKIISIYGNKKTRVASIGDVVCIVVKSWNRISKTLVEDKLKKKYRRGSIHKGVIVHTRKKVRRENLTWMWFDKNSIVLVDKKRKPLARRIKSVIPKEIADKYPTIASISSLIV